MTTTAVALSLTSGKAMEDLMVRSPFLTFTHSMWRGDFSRRALAQSCAVIVAVKTDTARSVKKRFIPVAVYRGSPRFGKAPDLCHCAQFLDHARENSQQLFDFLTRF